MLIAVNLSRSGRYEESMRWFHYLFDPTDTSSQLSPERYWRVKPFQSTDVERIEEILVNLSTGDDPVLQPTRSTPSRSGRTRRSGRTWSPGSASRRTWSRR